MIPQDVRETIVGKLTLLGDELIQLSQSMKRDVLVMQDAIALARQRILALESEIVQLKAKQPPLPQPDWSRAPERAQWWAVDADGTTGWYAHKPNYGDELGHVYASWASAGEAWREDVPAHLPFGIDWRTTLVQRPQEAQRD